MLTNIIAIQYMRNSRPSGEVESCSDRSHRAAPGGMAQAEPLEAPRIAERQNVRQNVLRPRPLCERMRVPANVYAQMRQAWAHKHI